MNQLISASETSMILDQLERKAALDQAIESLCPKTETKWQVWMMFCADASVLNALSLLNVDSPIFHSFITWLEVHEKNGRLPQQLELEHKAEGLWSYYQDTIVPLLTTFLTEKLQESEQATDIISTILRGQRLTKAQREVIQKIDARFETVRNINDLVTIAGFPESSSYEYSSGETAFEELAFFFQG